MDARHAAVALVATTYAVAAVIVPPRADFPVTTYAATSDAATAANLLGGLALLAAGALAALTGARVAVAATAMFAGVAWFGPDWVGWEGGAGIARSLGAVVAPFLLPLLVHLVLAAAGRGRLPARRPLAALYAVAAVVALSRAILRDPFEDPECWATCGGNVLLVSGEPGIAEALETAWRMTAALAGVALAVWASWSLVRSTRIARALRGPVLGPAVLVGLAEAAYAIALLAGPAEDPTRDGFAAIFLARAVSVAALAAGVAWSVLAARRMRVSLARLGAELGSAPRPGALRSALARALGDPGLEVAYSIGGRQLDAEGAPLVLPAGDAGRARTAIVRQDEVLAVVVHDAALLDAATLQREIGSASRLAVDNERLQAELLARLGDVRASRARIVEAGEAERRRLERDLHDGAQQRLLAASYELRLAHGEARAAGDAALARVLEQAAREAQEANEELRHLAHGIFPEVLAEAGLGAALESLADTAPLPVELAVDVDERLTATVESAAYAVVAEGVADAARRGATYVRAAVRRSGDVLSVEVADDGSPRAENHLHLADRAAALGGRLDTSPELLRAELPCA